MPEQSGAEPADTRSTKEVMTQWRKLEELKRKLVRDGIVSGDATPQQVIDAVRAAVPPNLF